MYHHQGITGRRGCPAKVQYEVSGAIPFVGSLPFHPGMVAVRDQPDLREILLGILAQLRARRNAFTCAPNISSISLYPGHEQSIPSSPRL
ncbi:MAG: hypothetical protein MZU91_14340 [Desulfosudis oleivorans]|nr:hypothetical protein [Desulfosudis oleivorans]